MCRKTTVWIFQAANWRDLTREGLDKATKEKPQKKNLISSNSSKKKKQRQKDLFYQSENQ